MFEPFVARLQMPDYSNAGKAGWVAGSAIAKPEAHKRVQAALQLSRKTHLMEPLKIFAALLALAVLAAAPGAGAPASSGEVDPVLFRRSCLDCPESHFCEYGFPGAPEGAVACVVGGRDKQLLYRRYEAADPPPAPNPRCLNNAAYFQCGPGAEWARGCDASSGDLATPGAASATGMCIPTNGVNTQYFCCQPVGQSNGACGDTYGGTHGRYRCFANANKDAALFQADGVAPRCMFDTGQVVASGGDGYCQVNCFALYTERNNTNGQGIKRSCDLARTGLVDTGNDVCSSDPTDSNVYASYGGLVPLKGYVAACCSPKPA
ncbi:hypothetical protein DFJ74DRAFT_724753 [Hyaloraphidium curvatum]|nr:hypothetical protein DFJ74DRAFT_724753 [Hyaloraphidium curvatum]